MKHGITTISILSYHSFFKPISQSLTPPNGHNSLSDNRPISDYRTFVGGATDIFVGKVLEQTGTEVRDGGLSSRALFKVEPIYNIKGNLGGAVKVSQYTTSHFDNAVIDKNSANYVIRPGYTYLLVLIYGGNNDPYYYLTLSPTSHKLISDNPNLTHAELEERARKDDEVYKLLSAYVNELPRNDLNSFGSLSEVEKQEVFNKFSHLISSRSVPEILPSAQPSARTPIAENAWILCVDGEDNDFDNFVDTKDPDCASVLRENNKGLCGDNIDDDRDGLKDAADPDCAAFYPAQRTPAPPPLPPHVTSTPASTSTNR